MPIISKTAHGVPGDSGYMKVVKVDAAGEFSCVLPAGYSDILGYGVVKGRDLKSLEVAFRTAMLTFKEASTTSREVISYEITDRPFMSRGVGLAIIAECFQEVTVTVGSEKHVRNERSVHRLRGSITNGAREELGGNRGRGTSIEWTQEREDFFNKLGASLEGIIGMLEQLEDPVAATAIADGLKPFLPALTAGKPDASGD